MGVQGSYSGRANLLADTDNYSKPHISPKPAVLARALDPPRSISSAQILERVPDVTSSQILPTHSSNSLFQQQQHISRNGTLWHQSD